MTAMTNLNIMLDEVYDNRKDGISKTYFERIGLTKEQNEEIIKLLIDSNVLISFPSMELYLTTEYFEFGMEESRNEIINNIFKSMKIEHVRILDSIVIVKNEVIKKMEDSLMASNQDFRILAEQFNRLQPLYYDDSGIWWVWNQKETRWQIIDEIDIMNSVDRYVKSKETYKSKTKNEILECIKRKSRLCKPKDIKETWIQFKNKIYDIATGEEFDATRDYFAVNPIPWEIGQSEDTPTIDKILKEWIVGTHQDESYVKTMYEIIAFSMSNSYFLHRIFCFTGSGSNGKGKFFGLLRKFLGDNNCTSVELDELIESRFHSAKLYKKLVCFMGETNFNAVKKTSRLKSLTGQDFISFEFKNKTPFDAVNYSKIMIATNSLPITEDRTDGFYRRWNVIEFPNKFTEVKEILNDIPEEEYRNLAKKCMRILKELWTTRRFTNEGSIDDRKRKYEERSNPLTMFIKEKCTVDINSDMPFFEFYEVLAGFLADRGYRILNKREVSKLLNDDGYEMKKMHSVNQQGFQTTVWHILGLHFKTTTLTDGNLLEIVSAEIN